MLVRVVSLSYCSHGHQVVTGTAEEAFDFHDKDKNGALNKKYAYYYAVCFHVFAAHWL